MNTAPDMLHLFNLVDLVDLVIVLTLVEATALVIYRQRTGRGIALRDFVPNMSSGLCLMLALRCLAADSGLASIALCLLAAGVAHGTDILIRLRHSAQTSLDAPGARA
jgi:hypothetical protein